MKGKYWRQWITSFGCSHGMDMALSIFNVPRSRSGAFRNGTRLGRSAGVWLVCLLVLTARVAADAGEDLDCAADSIFGQRPDGPADEFDAWISDEAVLFTELAWSPFDWIVGAEGTICRVAWWGTSLNAVDFTHCERQSDTFTIKFYWNDSGIPGEEIAAYVDVVPTKTETESVYNPPGFPGPYPLYRYEVTLDPCLDIPGGAAFVSIMGSGSETDQCLAALVSSSDGDDYTVVQTDDGSYRYVPNDTAFCLLPAEPTEPDSWGVYHSQGDFSLTQGQNQWYYLGWDETLEEYFELTPMPGPRPHLDTWYAPAGEGWVNLRAFAANPGQGVAAVRAWEAPGNGTIQITHVKRFMMGVPCGGDGVDVVFLRNDEVIWGPERIDANELKAQEVPINLTTTVSAGDRIYCRVSEVGTERCTEPVVAYRIGYIEDSPLGTTYIHFNDNSASELLVPDSVTNSGKEWSTVSDGVGHLIFNNPGGSMAGWAGDFQSGGAPLLKFSPPVAPLTGDFTAQILYPDVSEILAISDGAGVGIVVVPTGGADGGGTGTYGMALGVITKLTTPEGQGMLDGWTTTQVGGNWGYIVPGEAMTATARAALRYVRTGDTLSLYAAYDADAPATDDPSSGNFHLVNSQTISGAVDLYIMLYSAAESAAVSIDDVYITGPMVPDFTSPAEDPGAGLPVRIENSANLGNSSEIIFDLAWSNDGKKVAYLAAPAGQNDVSLKMFDLVAREEVTLVAFAPAGFIRSWGLTWSPDDEYLYFISYPEPGDLGWGMLSRCSATETNQTSVTRSLLGIADFEDEPIVGGTVNYPVSLTVNGEPKLLVTAGAVYPDFSMWSTIFVLDLDAEGNPVLPGVPITDLESGWAGIEQSALSPSGDALLVCMSDDPTTSQLYMFTGLQNIITGVTAPFTGLDDPRIYPVDVNRNYVYSPGFSQDGTMIFYSKDMTGRYWHGINDGFRFENYFECDFDIMVNTVSDVMQGRTPLRLPKWGNQMGLKASGGGTRVAWTEAYHSYATSSVYAATVRHVETAPLAVGELLTDITLDDGSGTRLSVAEGTVIGGVDPGATSVDFSVFTPISPLEEAALDPASVPVVRDFAPNGITFNPPAQLRFTYTDAEVRDLGEENLNVLWMHDGQPQFLPVIGIDTEANHVIVEVPGFSEFGLTSLSPDGDADGDGITDLDEMRDLDPEDPGLQNPFDPQDPDTTGDHGTIGPDGIPDGQNDWDGDGMTNAEEFRWGFNANDAESYGILPAASVWGLVMLAALLLFIVCVRYRASQKGVAPIDSR